MLTSFMWIVLCREDIGMSLRLVVNYSGMKINTVKGVIRFAFEFHIFVVEFKVYM
ncbi:hypothetical protein BVRB_9g225650 [Beta vulgaris subsp. vulgaris]|uniref:Uncharacterized protein n=1 Tax=Beta vulgaris subsp. vulgaris TaxID=3555 RepID=A0A0J8B581_BETVV|nr:hypothetical protein BVRB_9g225650 [Beta vulgaris subsp. vulgaris]